MDRAVRRSPAFAFFILALLRFCAAVCSAVPVAERDHPVLIDEKSVRVDVMRDQSATGSWCIAKPSADEVHLQGNIDFACDQENVNCSAIQTSGPCHYPYNVVNHASVAMNLYYKANNRLESACFFAGTALTVLQDPSSGSCLYA